MQKLLLKNLSALGDVLKRAKYIIVFVSFSAVVSLCAASSVIAAAGLVPSIGGVTFIQGAKQFWVSGARPTFSGGTSPSSHVDITIGGVKNGVVADASGNWSYAPAIDLTGNNQVTVATASSAVTFTLTIGALPANIASASGGTLSRAGNINPTLFILGGGISLLVIEAFGLKRSPR